MQSQITAANRHYYSYPLIGNLSSLSVSLSTLKIVFIRVINHRDFQQIPNTICDVYSCYCITLSIVIGRRGFILEHGYIETCTEFMCLGFISNNMKVSK